MDRMIGKRLNGYSVLELIGEGGNAKVYKVKDLVSSKIYALKMLKVFRGERFKKNYSRFKDEIKMVIRYQKRIRGILPIIKYHLPEKPCYYDKPYYIMPIATPIYKIINNENIEEIMDCIKCLTETLIALHNKGIVHRDIKPENLYYFEGKWVFADFGLVDYPTKDNLTGSRESVGPKTTIAPEMKRNAKDADGSPADIYSLAKTLWILLTGVKKGFEGQYSHKIELFNLAQYRRHDHITSLHELLTRATSNTPEDRPTAAEFYEIVNDWFDLNHDYQRRNLVEWEFVIKDIIPNTKPVMISWTNIDDIVYVLQMISKISSLNHMFMPDGGGMDLIDCRVSNEPGFIDLNFGYIIKLKPTQLALMMFDKWEWNYFLLETEKLSPVIKAKDSLELLVEITPGEYAEYYHANYGHYNNQPLPSTARVIYLGLGGTYAIFAKTSTYNKISQTYNGYQNKMSPLKFNELIKEMIQAQDFAEQNPELNRQKVEANKLLAEKRLQNKREIFKERYELELKKWLDFVNEYELPEPNSSKLPTPNCSYTLKLFNTTFERTYYLSLDKNLIQIQNQTLENPWYFYAFIDVLDYISKLNWLTKEFSSGWEYETGLDYKVDIQRIKRPKHQFTKQELTEILKNGNDFIDNTLVIDLDGYLKLLDASNYEYVDFMEFPVMSWEFSAYQNSIGEYAKLSYIDDLYRSLLSGWYMHLELNKGIIATGEDFYNTDITEDEYIALIKSTIERYDEH